MRTILKIGSHNLLLSKETKVENVINIFEGVDIVKKGYREKWTVDDYNEPEIEFVVIPDNAIQFPKTAESPRDEQA